MTGPEAKAPDLTSDEAFALATVIDAARDLDREQRSTRQTATSLHRAWVEFRMALDALEDDR